MRWRWRKQVSRYLVKNGVVDDSHHLDFVDDESNGNTHEGKSVDEVGCAVQRVNQPSGCICQYWHSIRWRGLLSYQLHIGHVSTLLIFPAQTQYMGNRMGDWHSVIQHFILRNTHWKSYLTPCRVSYIWILQFIQPCGPKHGITDAEFLNFLPQEEYTGSLWDWQCVPVAFNSGSEWET